LKLGALALLAVGGFGYSRYDRANNYIPVRVRADKVETLCYGKQTERDILTKTTRTTKEVDCKTLRALVASHPDFKGFTVYENTYVSFRYKSPVDNKTHVGRVIETRNLDGKPIRKRDVFDALVSNKMADKVLPL
jgi:predicted RNA-binding protein (virulence factor B family)